jgi:hypothetical protein
MSARILNVSPEAYFDLPHFSASTAKVLIAKSPAHARAENKRKPTKALDAGNVIHRLVLGKGKDYQVIDADDWRTNVAKAKRDEARALGLVPVLAADFERYQVASERITSQLADHDIVLDGDSELAFEWNEYTSFGPVACRGMMDHVWLDRGVILDLKITADASPTGVERTAENFGYAIQSAAYTSGLSTLRPELAGRIKFIFAFAEQEEPFALNLREPDGVFRELGERRWRRAVTTWARCTANNEWPAYDAGSISPPPWALAREDFEGG